MQEIHDDSKNRLIPIQKLKLCFYRSDSFLIHKSAMIGYFSEVLYTMSVDIPTGVLDDIYMKNKIILKIPFSRSVGNETDIEISNVILNIYRIVIFPLDASFVEIDVTDFVQRYFQMNKKLYSLRLFFEPLIEDKNHLIDIQKEQIELNAFDI